MSVKFRKSLQALTVVLPLAFVGGQMPAMAATISPIAHQVVTSDVPPAPPAPTAPTQPAPAENSASTPQAVDPQSQVTQTGSANNPGMTIPAMDLKEDIAQVCAGAPILPFKIGSAATLKDLLVKLHLMDGLSEVCATTNTIGAGIEKMTGPGGSLDLDALLH
jgi:hypothetical protein